MIHGKGDEDEDREVGSDDLAGTGETSQSRHGQGRINCTTYLSDHFSRCSSLVNGDTDELARNSLISPGAFRMNG